MLKDQNPLQDPVISQQRSAAMLLALICTLINGEITVAR